jgi:Ca2+-binding RTX toxin-like protein
VVGTDADDVLFVPEGGIGCGLGGNDLLRADKHGNTRLFGGDGDDVFCAENNDADSIHGGDGEDRARADDSDTVKEVEGDIVLIGCVVRR